MIILKGIDTIHQLIKGWVAEKKIPGAVVDIQVKNKIKWQAAYGTASLDTIFDAASLTKVVVALPVIMMLVQSSKLSLQDPVQKYIPEFRHAEVTIEHCLRHVSGLPSVLPDFRERYSKSDVKQLIMAQELEFSPGERVQYSDLGLVLIGWIISRLTKMPLDEFAREAIFMPLGMTDSYFNPPANLRERIAPTEWDGNKYLIGEVHDETCYRLGGVAGSAGLFATAEDLSKYARSWLYPEQYSLWTRASVDACTQSVFRERGIGWQVQDSPEGMLSCGPHWPTGSFGHTGYTGTSIWINPADEVTVVFLTNAVHLGRDHVLKDLRPILHEAVLDICVDK
ncbi:serine hydrolase [Paenibacillus dokdonensis]|uniref:Serine hydrolase n=1 Tax=Paenibacillus dokdonensis TaxID=2567944 RepID=A0ABU6GKS4_9BACL|nr:serine hydrolase domain-containing protein [Paenibacillus dokdonensis]MEC0240347.1 serine hydrolase [Paenibacillus dokdonensis]